MHEEYIQHLYDSQMEGYVQLLKLKNGQAITVYSTQYDGIREFVEKVEGETNYYITPNSFYIPYRASSNIRHFRALYIDIDIKNDSEYSKTEIVYLIYILAYEGKIPRPTMVVDSGGGLHVYWRIEHAPMGAIYSWQELQDYLYRQLKHLGADLQATDAARLLRLPGTINSRTKTECEVLVKEDIRYSMYDLKKKYLKKPHRKRHKPNNKKNTKAKVKPLFNSYTLHMARSKDLETLCRLRNYEMTGCRNMVLHCYAYWQGVTVRDFEHLEQKTYELNTCFTSPLKSREVKDIVKSVPKAVEKFIDYEQGVRCGEYKRVTKGMHDKDGYWYKNETLIERLDITEYEQKHLKTIISEDERNRRRNLKRKQERRNENGLTRRQQAKQDRQDEILRLREKGYSYSEIAKELKISKPLVSWYL